MLALAVLLAAVGDSGLRAAAEPLVLADATGNEAAMEAGVKTATHEAAPDSQESPAREMQAKVNEKVMAALKKIKSGRGGGRELNPSQEVVTVIPGRNVEVPISADHLNRIVTPFEEPAVHTVDKAKTKIDGNSVYVSIGADDGPAAMFITDRGQDDPSISLTLVPKVTTPKEVRLKLDGNWPVTISGGSGTLVGGSSKAAKWEKSQPYMDAIQQVLLHIARGEVPQGYNMRDYFNYDPKVTCRLPVQIDPRQVLEGHNFQVIVSRLTNKSSAPLVLNEEACYHPGVRAVALWPWARLEPRQSAELYVVVQRSSPQSPRMRPSVINTLPGEVTR